MTGRCRTSPSSESSPSCGVRWLRDRRSAPELAGVALPEALRGRFPPARLPPPALPPAAALPARLVVALPAMEQRRSVNGGAAPVNSVPELD